MKKNQTEHCPFCGKKSWSHQTRQITLCYKSTPIVVKQPGFWCDACDEGVIGGEDRKATQPALLAEINKML